MLSFQLIFQLYLNIFEKIDIEHGSFSAEELNPTTEELKQQVAMMISKFE
jgi:hypothetical protein